ncbi:hypothetical protein MRX96_014394 [Rhipicephalus microplus]
MQAVVGSCHTCERSSSSSVRVALERSNGSKLFGATPVSSVWLLLCRSVPLLACTGNGRADLTDIAHPTSGETLPLSPGLPTSALRAAWIPKCVLYHLRCANAKLEWRIPQPPLQSDYRQLQAHSEILHLQRLATRRGGARAGQVGGVSRCRFKSICFEGRATQLQMA